MRTKTYQDQEAKLHASKSGLSLTGLWQITRLAGYTTIKQLNPDKGTKCSKKQEKPNTMMVWPSSFTNGLCYALAISEWSFLDHIMTFRVRHVEFSLTSYSLGHTLHQTNPMAPHLWRRFSSLAVRGNKLTYIGSEIHDPSF